MLQMTDKQHTENVNAKNPPKMLLLSHPSIPFYKEIGVAEGSESKGGIRLFTRSSYITISTHVQ